MNYNDEMLPDGELINVMNSEYNSAISDVLIQAELNEMGEHRQRAEMEEIFRLLEQCETFFKWLEGKDENFSELKELLAKTHFDKIVAQGCSGKYRLDYRYACDNDFNKNCCDYCKCEMEVIDKIIKLLSLKHSIVDKQCMIKLIQSRMDTLKLVFHKYIK